MYLQSGWGGRGPGWWGWVYNEAGSADHGRGGERPRLKIFKTLKIIKILRLNNFNILNSVHFPILKIYKILTLFNFNIVNIFNNLNPRDRNSPKIENIKILKINTKIT